MKILIVKLSAFGDIIHAQPAMQDLLNHAEVSELHWLVDARYAFATELMPKSVTVHQVALKGSQRLRHAWQAIKQLRQERFDCVIDLQGLIKSGLIARAICKKVYGFDASSTPEWPNHWFVHGTPFAIEERHVVQKYRHIAALALRNPPPYFDYQAPRFALPQTAQHDAEARLQAYNITRNFVILHLGGGWQTKQMSLAFWQQLVKLFAQKGCQALLTWGNLQEQNLALRLVAATEAVTHEHPLNLALLGALALQADAFVGGDTGASHLAAAVGATTITLWGPSAPWNSAPLGATHQHIESHPSCGPCFKRTCKSFVCMPSLRPQQIIDAWERGLNAPV
ncbi:MAG: glycosyltransferase family 9 protein [Zetaproteobacteria bacterium]|nr:glycosyltransferase family 9 protein [Zetaproteobacteria bacterium]